MTIALSGGGAVSFRIDSRNYQIISAGVTGTLINPTAPVGSVIRLVVLHTNTAGTQSGISLIRDGVTIETTKTLADNTPSGDLTTFSVARNSNVPGVYDVVECESFEVIKDAGNTLQDIIVVYEVGKYE